MLAAQIIQDLLLEVLDPDVCAHDTARAAAADEDVSLRKARPFAEQVNGFDPGVPLRLSFDNLRHVPIFQPQHKSACPRDAPRPLGSRSTSAARSPTSPL